MINQQLLDFIKQSLQQGLTKEKISRELLTNGWAQQDIEEGFSLINNVSSNQSNNQIPPIKKNKSKFVKYYPVAIIIFIIAFLVFVLQSSSLFLFGSMMLYLGLVSPIFLLGIISFFIKNRKVSIILNIIITIIIIFPVIIVGSGIVTSFVLSKNVSQEYNQEKLPSTQSQNSQTNINSNPVDEDIIWNTYTDSVQGLSFEYPNSLNNPYVNFQKPNVLITPQGSTTINSLGCLSSKGDNPQHLNLIYNGLNFCSSIGSEKLDGGSVFYENYTFLKNGNYYTILYIIQIDNCELYKDGNNSDYKSCIYYSRKYNVEMHNLIKESILTLKVSN